MAAQLPLFPHLTARFPSTRYQGSKSKLAQWIWEQIEPLRFSTCLDAFGGTGAVAYRLKQAGKQVTYNDVLRFNYHIGQALIENDGVQLAPADVEWLLRRHSERVYPTFVQDHFPDIYFTDAENAWIDQTITNVKRLADPLKFALAFFALCQACIVKRPYNLFHRKNLYIRFAEIERSFGNKASWDKPFEDWFRVFADEANQAVLTGKAICNALNQDVREIVNDYDLVYLDPPYISKQGVAVDYRDFYHFLEGLARYGEWGALIDHRSKHRRLRPQPNEWTDKNRIHDAFDHLLRQFRDSIIVISYRSDGIPSEAALADLLGQYKSSVKVRRYGQYQYALSKNVRSEELVVIGV